MIHIASGDLWAGAESQIYHVIRQLTCFPDLLIKVVLLNEGELAQRLRALNVELTIFDETLYSTLRILFKLVSLLHNEPIDVIHTHRIKENLIGAIAGFLCRTPSVRTVHGGNEHPPGTVFSRAYVASALDSCVAKNLQTRVIAVSKHLCGQLNQQFGTSKTIFIPNGIDTEFVRSSLSANRLLPTSTTNIALIGRLVPVKRADLYLLIASELRRRHPHRFRFYILGDGPLRGELEKNAQQLGLQESCSFLGFVSDPLPLLSQFDAIVLTSDHEGLPMVILEALALGVPVVAHAVGGIPEVVNSAQQGAVIHSQDVSDFADAIERHAKPKGAIGASLLDSQFDIRNTAQQYAALYRSIARRTDG